tara:strand:+ start:359 stop:982 length:624 start_codon:yes stop_codon:yes gene_type:complete
MIVRIIIIKFKRFSDIIFSAFILLLILPLLFLISLLIIIDDGFPILFSQKRIGYKNRIFQMYKFRSMKKNTEKCGTGYYCYENDKRITNFGKKIRALSLDELPQLFNILKGDMSFVGPRPPIFDELDSEDININLVSFLDQRTKVKPGLTGYAQVMSRNDLDWNQKLSLDKKYLNVEIEKRIFLDFKIILLTFFEILSSKGIYDKKE